MNNQPTNGQTDGLIRKSLINKTFYISINVITDVSLANVGGVEGGGGGGELFALLRPKQRHLFLPLVQLEEITTTLKGRKML